MILGHCYKDSFGTEQFIVNVDKNCSFLILQYHVTDNLTVPMKCTSTEKKGNAVCGWIIISLQAKPIILVIFYCMGMGNLNPHTMGLPAALSLWV
jgi:hypothetical protein